MTQKSSILSPKQYCPLADLIAILGPAALDVQIIDPLIYKIDGLYK